MTTTPDYSLQDGFRAPLPDGEERPAVSVLRLINVVLRRRVLVAGSGMLLFGLVVTSTLIRPRTYTADASFVAATRSSRSGAASLAAQFGIEIGGNEAAQSPQFYVDLVRSREILKPVATGTYEFLGDTGRVTATLVQLVGPRDGSSERRARETVQKLQAMINASPAQRTGVITIRVTARSPELAAQIAQRVVDEVNRFNLEERQSAARIEREFTERRLAEASVELRAAENSLQEFLLRNRAYRSSPVLTLEHDRRARDIGMRQQLYTTLAQAYEQSKIDEVRDSPVISVLERPQVPLDADRRGLLRKGLLALVVGTIVGAFFALLLEYADRTQKLESDASAEFAALRRAAIDDLTHPWRPLQRAFRRREVRG